MKKLLSLILCLMLAVMPMLASAEETVLEEMETYLDVYDASDEFLYGDKMLNTNVKVSIADLSMFLPLLGGEENTMVSEIVAALPEILDNLEFNFKAQGLTGIGSILYADQLILDAGISVDVETENPVIYLFSNLLGDKALSVDLMTLYEQYLAPYMEMFTDEEGNFTLPLPTLMAYLETDPQFAVMDMGEAEGSLIVEEQNIADFDSYVSYTVDTAVLGKALEALFTDLAALGMEVSGEGIADAAPAVFDPAPAMYIYMNGETPVGIELCMAAANGEESAEFDMVLAYAPVDDDNVLLGVTCEMKAEGQDIKMGEIANVNAVMNEETMAVTVDGTTNVYMNGEKMMKVVSESNITTDGESVVVHGKNTYYQAAGEEEALLFGMTVDSTAYVEDNGDYHRAAVFAIGLDVDNNPLLTVNVTTDVADSDETLYTPGEAMDVLNMTEEDQSMLSQTLMGNAMMALQKLMSLLPENIQQLMYAAE